MTYSNILNGERGRSVRDKINAAFEAISIGTGPQGSTGPIGLTGVDGSPVLCTGKIS
jgi:hypothetical protein